MDMQNDIKHWKELLRIEEKTQDQAWTDDKNVKNLRSKGLAIYPLKMTRESLGIDDYPKVKFSFGFDFDSFQLKIGSAINIFSMNDDTVLPGMLIYLDKCVGEIVIFHYETPDWVKYEKFGVKLTPDSKSFSAMHGLLDMVYDHEILKKNFKRLHTVNIKEKPSEFNVHFDQNNSNSTLNASQSFAVDSFLSNKQMTILHGPPGTGKTTTLIAYIQQAVNLNQKVLVSAPSNAAVDHISKSLIKANVAIVRLGNSIKVDEDVFNYTPTGILLNNKKKAKRIKKLKIQAEEYQKLANQYKRSFGKEERDQRGLLRNEEKLIRKEIRDLTKFIVEKAISDANVIIGTPVGLQDDLIKDTVFDSVILDEAGQCLAPLGFLLLKYTENIIFAGDHFQLPPTVISNEAAKKGLNKSILELAFDAGVKRYFLDTQYRMPAKLIGFSSKYFYEDKLKSYLQGSDAELVFFDTAGAAYEEAKGEEDYSLKNINELNFIHHIKSEFFDNSNESIVFISPYSGQVSEAKTLFDDFNCSTIDSFQGQEADVVILSLVRSNIDGKIGFLKDYRRMNVALTRAKKRLFIIGDSATIGADAFFDELLRYIENNGTYRSVFEFPFSM